MACLTLGSELHISLLLLKEKFIIPVNDKIWIVTQVVNASVIFYAFFNKTDTKNGTKTV